VHPNSRLERRLFAFLLLAGLSGAARAAPSGFVSPGRGQALAGGDSVEVRWTAPCGSAASEAELVLSLDGGRTFPIRITPEISPCAGGFRWKVPDLESSRVRLALRTGSGEESDDERLTLVSEEFSIAADGDDDDELLPGAREVWTRQALDGEGTEGLPVESMGGSTADLVAPVHSCDAHEPPPSGGVVRADGGPRAERPASLASRGVPSPAERPSALPRPLRL
jgi:hypothetical protein